jgi:2-dehydropantoate 2-reductase
MSRIAIIGPGAIGGVMTGWLDRTKRHEIIVCGRRPMDRLVVETPSGTFNIKPTVLTNPNQGFSVDWILVCTKAYDAADAAKWFEHLGATGANIAILQNGVEHRERFASFFPTSRLLPVMVDCPSERIAPTHIRQRGPATLVVPDDASGRAFVALFAGTDIAVSVASDFKSVIWRKLCLNAAGVISALLLQPSGIMRDEQVGELARQIVREAIAVGRAEGADLPDSLADTVVATYRQAPVDGVNSIHADRLAHRQTEIDARNGVIVRLGQRHGIATPCNQMAHTLLTALTAKELS